MTLGLALAQFLKSFRITVKHKAAKLHAHSPKGHSIVNKTTQQWNVAATVHPDDEAECIRSQMAVVHPFVCKKTTHNRVRSRTSFTAKDSVESKKISQRTREIMKNMEKHSYKRPWGRWNSVGKVLATDEDSLKHTYSKQVLIPPYGKLQHLQLTYVTYSTV